MHNNTYIYRPQAGNEDFFRRAGMSTPISPIGNTILTDHPTNDGQIRGYPSPYVQCVCNEDGMKEVSGIKREKGAACFELWRGWFGLVEAYFSGTFFPRERVLPLSWI